MTKEAESSPDAIRAEEPNFLTSIQFSDLDIPEQVLHGLADTGFVNCTPIQAQTLPISLAGRDVAGQAQTGTGKTAAFLVTLFARLLTSKAPEPHAPRALVLSPTRELAKQIFDDAQSIGRHTGLKSVQVVGGVDYVKQANLLKSGVDIVIATPGRVIDYYKQKVFNPEHINTVVIDEADRLLDLGFAKDMRYILSKLPPFDKRLSMLFSATLSYRVMELTYEYMNLPEFVAITPQEVAVDNIDQELYHVGEDKKLELLLGLLAREKWERMLIFVNTRSGVQWLTQKLKGNGWPAEGITGELPQRKRFKLMEDYKKGEIKILLATDVASRGIHVDDITHVINYDLPQDPENYVHRIGRTARAGKSGRALSLACEKYVFHLDQIEQLLDFKLPLKWPEEDWYVEDRCGPVILRDRGKGKPAKHKKAGRKGRKEAASSFFPKWPLRKKGADYWPGSFFGFAPPAQPETKESSTEKKADTGSKAKSSPSKSKPANGKRKPAASNRKRRRRPRRRRKSDPTAAAKSGGSETEAAGQ